MSFKEKVQQIRVDSEYEIPWIVWLLENPRSFLALPGAINLFDHDCLHILLERDLSPGGEAFVVGFCMGNDPSTKPIHIKIFKFASRYLYPTKFKFRASDFVNFAAGFDYGKSLAYKRINLVDFNSISGLDLETIRQALGINLKMADKTVTEVRYRTKKSIEQAIRKRV